MSKRGNPFNDPAFVRRWQAITNRFMNLIRRQVRRERLSTGRQLGYLLILVDAKDFEERGEILPQIVTDMPSDAARKLMRQLGKSEPASIRDVYPDGPPPQTVH